MINIDKHSRRDDDTFPERKPVPNSPNNASLKNWHADSEIRRAWTRKCACKSVLSSFYVPTSSLPCHARESRVSHGNGGSGTDGGIIYQSSSRLFGAHNRFGKRERAERERAADDDDRELNGQFACANKTRAPPSVSEHGDIAVRRCDSRTHNHCCLTSATLTWRAIYHGLTTSTSATTSNVITGNIVGDAAHTVRASRSLTVTTALLPRRVTMPRLGHFTLEQGPLPSLPFRLDVPLFLAADWFILIVDPASPRVSSAPNATTTTIPWGPRHGLPSLSLPLNLVLTSIGTGPHAKSTLCEQTIVQEFKSLQM